MVAEKSKPVAPKKTTAKKPATPVRVKLEEAEDAGEELDESSLDVPEGSTDASAQGSDEADDGEDTNGVDLDDSQDEDDEDLSVADKGLRDLLSAGSAASVLPEISGPVDLPPVFDVVPDGESPSGSKFIILAFASGCMECVAFVEGGSEDHSKDSCHFSRGNEFCPAKHATVAFVGARMLAIKKIKKAQEAGDVNRLLGHIAALDKLSLDDKNYVLQKIGML